jgi:hypothetical protein
MLDARGALRFGGLDTDLDVDALGLRRFALEWLYYLPVQLAVKITARSVASHPGCVAEDFLWVDSGRNSAYPLYDLV